MFLSRDYDQMKIYCDIFTSDERICDRFVVDCELFANLIDGMSCDLKGIDDAEKDKYEQIIMERIGLKMKWII